MITFSTDTRVIFKNKLVGKNIDQLVDYINNHTNTDNLTAFYKGVYEACQYCSKHKLGKENQWIVALTDGEDNSSKKLRAKWWLNM